MPNTPEDIRAAKAHGIFVGALAAMMGIGCLINTMQAKNGDDIVNDHAPHTETTAQMVDSLVIQAPVLRMFE